MKYFWPLAFLSFLASPAFAYEPDEALANELERRATDIPFLLEETAHYPEPLAHRALVESQRLYVAWEREPSRLEAYSTRLMADLSVWTANMALIHRHVQKRCGTANLYKAELEEQASNRKLMIEMLQGDAALHSRLVDEAAVEAETAEFLDDPDKRQRYCDGSSTLMRKIREAEARKRES